MPIRTSTRLFVGTQRLPRHIGFIPDGNRRWAVQHGLAKEQGDASGVAPGLALFEACNALGVDEVSVYGFRIIRADQVSRPINFGLPALPLRERSLDAMPHCWWRLVLRIT